MVELKDTTLYRPAPSSASEDVSSQTRESSIVRAVRARSPRTFLPTWGLSGSRAACSFYSGPGCGTVSVLASGRANPPPPRNSFMSGKRSLVGLLVHFGRTVMHPGPGRPVLRRTLANRPGAKTVYVKHQSAARVNNPCSQTTKNTLRLCYIPNGALSRRTWSP